MVVGQTVLGICSHYCQVPPSFLICSYWLGSDESDIYRRCICPTAEARPQLAYADSDDPLRCPFAVYRAVIVLVIQQRESSVPILSIPYTCHAYQYYEFQLRPVLGN
jgi:hypothetical protein